VGLPETLASIPDDQKAMIMRVISMTPEQIALLPPQERASIIQLVRISNIQCASMLMLILVSQRATLGLPS